MSRDFTTGLLVIGENTKVGVELYLPATGGNCGGGDSLCDDAGDFLSTSTLSLEHEIKYLLPTRHG